MKRMLALSLLFAIGVSSAEPAFAARIIHRGARRTTVIVRPGWPLRRAQRSVVVHTGVAVRVTPVRYVAPVFFTGMAVGAAIAANREALVWEGAAALDREDDWTESTLSCDGRGTGLWLQVKEGKVQFDWAEVVFANGDAQVVDFSERTYEEGLYTLLDFRDGRRVDHVRFVSRAATPEARVVLKMQK
jgi:hypothetical protein